MQQRHRYMLDKRIRTSVSPHAHPHTPTHMLATQIDSVHKRETNREAIRGNRRKGVVVSIGTDETSTHPSNVVYKG